MNCYSGPWVGQLVKGNTVTLPDGREVRTDGKLTDWAPDPGFTKL